jgi:2-polyprenyl-6-methoxyphenol hydroxylase-like FAD-dependent oxidoreductase
MALADALALAEATLDQTPRGEAPSDASLAAYEATRRGPNGHSLAFSHRAAPAFRALWTLPPLAHALPPALRLLDRSPARKARFLRAVGTAFQAHAGQSPER